MRHYLPPNILRTHDVMGVLQDHRLKYAATPPGDLRRWPAQTDPPPPPTRHNVAREQLQGHVTRLARWRRL